MNLWGKLSVLLKLFKLTASGKTHLGTCPICEHPTLFVKWDVWLRDNYLCLFCNSIPRQRALIHVLDKEFPTWRNLRIHESSPSGASSAKLKTQCANYEPTQYWPDLQPGAIRDGQRCENLEKMTFADETFDLVITQDVFEHVMHPDRAFREIARTLKPAGAHIFTVPYYRGKSTVIRAVKTSAGIDHLKEPLFHVNPIDEKGSLVVTEWGDELPDFIESHGGMKTQIYNFHDPHLGLEAEFLDVFVSRKRSPHVE
jgi:SAM-dependent methyltransferase